MPDALTVSPPSPFSAPFFTASRSAASRCPPSRFRTDCSTSAAAAVASALSSIPPSPNASRPGPQLPAVRNINVEACLAAVCRPAVASPSPAMSTSAIDMSASSNPADMRAPAAEATDLQTTPTAGSKRMTPDSPSAKSSAPLAALSEDRAASPSLSKRLRAVDPSIKILPHKYEEADTKDLVVLISSMLMELIQYNDSIPLGDGRLTRFHSRTPPRISVRDYLQRITTHATLSPPILLSMVYYIDRLCSLYPAFSMSSLTVHRFLISSATVASKGLSDSFWTNKTYARVGGISVAELAILELDFLFHVEWRIVPQPEVLVDYYRSLAERCDGYMIDPGSK